MYDLFLMRLDESLQQLPCVERDVAERDSFEFGGIEQVQQGNVKQLEDEAQMEPEIEKI